MKLIKSLILLITLFISSYGFSSSYWDNPLGFIYQSGTPTVQSDMGLLYGKTDGSLYWLDDISGVERNLLLGGTTSLDSLSDVTIAAPSFRQVLTYDGAEWVNEDAGGLSQWVTATAYYIDDIVNEDILIYKALTDHTSGVFATDLANNDWVQLSDYSSSADVIYKDSFPLEGVLENSLNKGLGSDIVMSDDGGLAFSWSGGAIYDIVTKLAVITNPGSSTCTDNDMTYLYWVSGATFTVSTTMPSGDNVAIATIGCQDGDIVSINRDEPNNARESAIVDGLSNILHLIVTDGVEISEDVDVTNTWDVSLSAGTYYIGSIKKTSIPAIDSRTTPMTRHFKVAGVWSSDTNIEIDVTKYNDGTDLAAINPLLYYKSCFYVSETTIHWIYPEVGTSKSDATQASCPTLPEGLSDLAQSSSLTLLGSSTEFPLASSVSWVDIRPLVEVSDGSGIDPLYIFSAFYESYSTDAGYESVHADTTAQYNSFGIMPNTVPPLAPDYPTGIDIYGGDTNIGTEWTLSAEVQFLDQVNTAQQIVFGVSTVNRGIVLGLNYTGEIFYISAPSGAAAYACIINISGEILVDAFNSLNLSRDGNDYELSVNGNLHSCTYVDAADTELRNIGTKTTASGDDLNGYVRTYEVASISNPAADLSGGFAVSAVLDDGSVYWNTASKVVRDHREGVWRNREAVNEWQPGTVYTKDMITWSGSTLYLCLSEHTSDVTSVTNDPTRWRVVGGSAGLTAWVTATDYFIGDTIIESNKLYKCLVDHTAGTFATDLASNFWVEISTALDQTIDGFVSGAGTVASTDTILEAIEKLDGNNIVNASDITAIETLTSANIIVGNGSNIATDVSMSGESTIDNLGAVTLDNDSVIAKVLTGYTKGALGSEVVATDTISEAIGKVDAAIDGHKRLTYGMSSEKADTSIVNTAGTLYFEVEKDGTGDMYYHLDGTLTLLDCTTGAGTGGKARVALTAGTASVPAINYIYVVDSGGGVGVLTASSTIPTGVFGWVGRVSVPDATTFNTTGAYMHQRYTDALAHDGRGALSYERERIRKIGAKYLSGVDQTLTITTNAGSADNVVFTTLEGIIYQLHRQTFPAFSGTPTYYVVNDSVSPYTTTTDLNTLLTDANGNSLADKRFNLVIWGAVNKSTGESKLYVNLPTGSYINDENTLNDIDNTAVTSIPAEINGVGFLIARLSLRHRSLASGTWTNLSGGTAIIDYRGLTPGFNTGGSIGGATNEFSDALFTVFDDGDSSKTLQFENSGITTATNRVLTVPDASGTIALTSDVIPIATGGTGEITAQAAIDSLTAVSGATVSQVLTKDISGNAVFSDAPSSSGINYVVNPDFEFNNNNWNSTDQTNFNVARTIISPLRGVGSMLITKAAGDFSTDYIYSDTFTIDSADQSSMTTLSFDSDFTNANYADDDIIARVYDITNSAYLTGDLYIKATKGLQTWDFQTTATGTQYQVRLYQNSTTALAYTARLDNIVFGPQKSKVLGTPSTDWADYTPVWSSVGTAVSLGNGVVTGKWRRVGDSMEIVASIKMGSTTTYGTGAFLFDIPLGLHIDTAKVITDSTIGVLGVANAIDSGTAFKDAHVLYYTSTTVRIVQDADNDYWQSNKPFTWSTDDGYAIKISVPIQGWSSNVVMSETTQNRDISFSARKSGNQTIIAGAGLTTLTSWTEFNDDTLMFDSTTGIATLIEDAVVNLTANALILYGATAPSDASVNIVSSVNGNLAISQLGDFIANKWTGASPSLSGYKGVKNETFELKVSSTGQNITVNASGSTFGVTKTNTGSQTIAQSEKIFVEYKDASGQSLNNGTVTTKTFDTEIEDTHGSFDGATGIFTAKRDDYYTVNLIGLLSDASTVSFSGADYISARVYINGVAGARIFFLSSFGGVTVNIAVFGTGEFHLNNKDTLEVRLYQNSGVTQNLQADTGWNRITISTK